MIRKARKEDCPELYDLIHEIFVDMELPLLDRLDPDVLKAAMVRAMHAGRLPVQLPEWPCL